MSATIPPTPWHTKFFGLTRHILTIVKNRKNTNSSKFCPLTSDVCEMTSHSPIGQYHFSEINITFHMVLFPPGSCMECFPGEGLPYGIPSGGTLAIWYCFPGGGGGDRGDSVTNVQSKYDHVIVSTLVISELLCGDDDDNDFVTVLKKSHHSVTLSAGCWREPRMFICFALSDSFLILMSPVPLDFFLQVLIRILSYFDMCILMCVYLCIYTVEPALRHTCIQDHISSTCI